MKSKIYTIKLSKILVNFVIVLMLVVAAAFAVVGGGIVSASNVVNGVYYSGNEESNKVSLMINVYWGTEFLDEMLEILDKHDVKATFFIGGTWAVRENEMLEKIYESGHEIANHAYTHKDLDKATSEEIEKEILTTHNLVKKVIGCEMNLFAPPSGAYSKATVDVASTLGYKVVMWTRDTVDWRDQDAEIIYSRAVNGAKGGDLVLMHPTKATAQALERIITTLQANGLTLTTVSDTLA